MICCFTCSSSNVAPLADSMDHSQDELSTVKDYLETERLCQDLCRSISGSVTNDEISGIEAKPFPVLMPKIADEEMEGILNEITELLAAQSGSAGNSDSSDTALLDSNRSVDDILKDAEKLVTMSLAHLNNSMGSRTPTPSAQSTKRPEAATKPPKSNQNSVKFSDVTETIPFQETDISPFKIRSKSDPEIAHSKKSEKIEKRDVTIRLNTSSSPSPSIHLENKSMHKEQVDLKLSDLSTVYEVTTPVEKEGRCTPENLNKSTINNNLINNDEEKSEENGYGITKNLENDNDFLWNNLDFLNNKVGLNKRKDQSNEIVEDNRLALLEEEVNSQVELIASYQRENERLCADIIKAKVLLLGALLAGAAALPTASTPPPTTPEPPPDTTQPLAAAPVSFFGAQVIKVVKAKTPVLEELIEKENMDVWSGNATHIDILIPKKKVESVKKTLSDNKIGYSIMIENLQKAIDQQNPPIPEEEEDDLEGRKGHRMNWQKYQRLETIYGYLDYLAQTYPAVASIGVIGKTHERRPIKYIKISSGNPGAKAFLIDGGIHAREWISPAVVTYIVKELVENRNSLPADLQGIDFYVIPVLNPDGYEYSHTNSRMWRKNRARGYGCVGVDLNRNFNHHWGGKGTSGNVCSEIYRGTSPASEPETQALMNFVKTLSGNLRAYVTFHSYGQYILIPYGFDYNNYPPYFEDIKAVGDQAAYAMLQSGGRDYTVGNTAHTLYPAAGGSDDWVKANSNAKYTYTIELRDKGNYGFLLPSREILPTSNEAFEAIKVISAAAARA